MMRINSGEYKYRSIEVPENARPTTEKVREAVFSILIGKVEGALVLESTVYSTKEIEKIIKSSRKTSKIAKRKKNLQLLIMILESL